MNPARLLRDSVHLLPAAILLLVLPLNHTMALRMGMLFLAAGIAWHVARRHPILSIPLKLPLAAWGGIALLSVTWSFNPVFSLNEIKTEIGYGLIVFFTFFILTRGGAELGLWLRALMAGVSIPIVIAMVHFWQRGGWAGYDWEWQNDFVPFSTYLATLSPFLLYLLYKTPFAKFPQNAVWLLLPFFLLAAYATQNRMFWLSFGCVLLLFLALGGWRFRRSGDARRLFVIGLAGLLIAGVGFVATVKQRAVIPAESTTAVVAHTLAQSERYEIWGFWAKRIAERPFTGVGFGRDLPHFVYADLKPKTWHVLMFAHAHNLFADYLLQMGVAGLVVLLYLLGSLYREFWKLYRSSNDEISLVGICGMALVTAFITKNMTDDLFWRTDALLFWALTGMLLGYAKYSAARSIGAGSPATSCKA